eukprot:CAMPEP_0202880746 /NCGR_PEP_ID=MMETSP1391-20130828/35498_1 /ASSEMBLY_ACC=CAM_ASM_000867 /TAXON_ID=1034604 /ORGANISM="Chlamydomonas leiostraca, Strain SAG 11-49" /LENGTH=80 /DNA_ID=CAMNT_0049563289 /DNA_START=224 /DNA_END=462 /DNA_ORIENTATION=-
MTSKAAEWFQLMEEQLSSMHAAVVASGAASLPGTHFNAHAPPTQALYSQRASLLLDMPPSLAWQLLSMSSSFSTSISEEA